MLFEKNETKQKQANQFKNDLTEVRSTFGLKFPFLTIPKMAAYTAGPSVRQFVGVE